MKNKMIGNYSNEGVLNISATNLQEFESLIKKAKRVFLLKMPTGS